ncbi:MAG: F0F1 ATP synthase subunit A [Flavobacteriaceae bacterium]|nr:F0F1 ATP synthase subunit A [Flavobacteriaceae bacterium]
MQSKLAIKFLTVILFFFSFGLIAQDHSNEHQEVSHEQHEGTPEQVSLKTKIKESINHHLLDSHDFTFFSDSETGKHYGFPLPVILWDQEDGIQLFSSSKFHHGDAVAENNGKYYTLYHNKVYKTDAEGTITLDDHHHPTQAKPLDFSITKSVLMILITGILMLLAFVGMAKSFKKGPIVTGAGRFLEPIILYIRDDIAIPNIGEKKHRKYMPYLLTIFFFVWFLNLFGLTPLGVNVTGNIAITFALAIMTFIITQVSGNKNYWMHIFDPLGNSMPWYGKIPLYIILIPIEILGVFVKPFALMIRLYANIMAGHIVLMSLIGLIFVFQNWIGSSASFVLSFAISMIELLVALLQAYIFTMLSALYFGFAVVEHEEAH